MKIKYKTRKTSEIRLQIAKKKKEKKKAKARKNKNSARKLKANRIIEIFERIMTEDRLYINNRKSQKEKVV